MRGEHLGFFFFPVDVAELPRCWIWPDHPQSLTAEPRVLLVSRSPHR